MATLTRYPSQLQRESVVEKIEVKEWDWVDRRLPSSAIADLTRSQDKVVNIHLLPNGMTRVTANSFVGRIRLGSVDLVVKPKVPIPSLLMLLGEVHDLAHLVPEFAGFQKSPEIVDLLIHVFLNQVDSLIQYGLKRTYVHCQEELVPVRGRLDVRRTFALHMRAKPKVWCAFDDYTLDGLENQALLATLRAITSNGTLLQQRRHLAHKLTADFVGVSDVPIHAQQVETIVCDRLTSHYEPALRLAQIVLASMGLAHDFGGVESSGFLLNMNELFEQFVFRRLRALLGFHQVDVRRQVTQSFDESGILTIRPDLVIQAKNGGRLVADTKYKATNSPDPGDLYQMLAYCRVMHIQRGVLIVAGKGNPRIYYVRDGETTIDVVSVNLDGPIANVHESMQSLADWIRTCLGLKTVMAK